MTGRFRLSLLQLGVLGAAIAVILGAVAVLVVRGDDPSVAAPESAPAAAKLPAGFTWFRDPQRGFEIAYPKSWQRLQSADREVRLIATKNGRDSFLVRVIPLPATVDPANVGAARPVFDELLQGERINVLDVREITLGGVPGWFYLYTFADKRSGQEGVHSHYFLFNGSQLDILVFQALPKTAFRPLAPTFDAIAATYRPLR